jgi:hypothetical protein
MKGKESWTVNLEMFTLLKNLIGWIVAIVFFVAALANIAIYLETSTKWLWVARMLDDIATPETLTFIYRSSFLLAAALALLWMYRRTCEVETKGKDFESRLRRLEGSKDTYVSLRPDEVIHPSPDGVLWKWDAQLGADGPFCPRHRERLFHNNWLKQIQTENFDDSFLGGTWWFTCPKDQEDFKFTDLHHERVKNLRVQAAARLSKKA